MNKQAVLVPLVMETSLCLFPCLFACIRIPVGVILSIFVYVRRCPIEWGNAVLEHFQVLLRYCQFDQAEYVKCDATLAWIKYIALGTDEF